MFISSDQPSSPRIGSLQLSDGSLDLPLVFTLAGVILQSSGQLCLARLVDGPENPGAPDNAAIGFAASEASWCHRRRSSPAHLLDVLAQLLIRLVSQLEINTRVAADHLPDMDGDWPP